MLRRPIPHLRAAGINVTFDRTKLHETVRLLDELAAPGTVTDLADLANAPDKPPRADDPRGEMTHG
jgi:hypothetical protein